MNDNTNQIRPNSRARNAILVWGPVGLCLGALAQHLFGGAQQLAFGPAAWLVPLALFLCRSCGSVQMFTLMYPPYDRWWQQWWVIGLLGVLACAAVMAFFSLLEGHSFQTQLVRFTLVYGTLPALGMSAILCPLARLVAIDKR